MCETVSKFVGGVNVRQWWIQTGFHSFRGNPLLADLYYELFIEWLWFSVNVTPSLATDLRNLLLWLTLACASRKLLKTDHADRWAGSFARKWSKWAWLLKISCALRAQPYDRKPLQEILDPPLYDHNHGSTIRGGQGTNVNEMKDLYCSSTVWLLCM